ncbi:MAG: alpha/beta hydrolase [Xanthobacteraceae bacterium]
MSDDYTSRFIAAQDGLTLHVRAYGKRSGDHLPVVCLPGLARTGADFHEFALALSADTKKPRQAIALDYRGRGRSDYDRDAANYNLATEIRDLLAVLTALEIGPAVFVGTSRGGILVMLLATVRPTVLAGAVLNDIGPVIDPRGLLRIKNYVGKLPQPRSFEDAADIMRRLFSGHFPKLTAEEWMTFARRTFEEREGRLAPSYDPKLAKILDAIDIGRPLPPLWKEFDALARVPVMVIRGANSDVLSPDTVGAMRQRRSDLEVVEVPDQGHAPLLSEAGIIGRIAAFVARCEPEGANVH